LNWRLPIEVALMLTWCSRITIAVGSSLLLAAAGLYFMLGRAAEAEQALRPGEDSFGVALLGMMYGPAIILAAAAGLLALLLGLSAATIHRFRNPLH
jgi:hypothetical protein